MIKILTDFEQNSPEWYAARMGIPTASCFEKILTPLGKSSTQWEKYAHQILAEEILGHHIEGYQSAAMLEGKRREAEAVAAYEFAQDADTLAVGFIHNVPRTMGCSPDRLVGDDGMLELKNPDAHTHVDYLFDPEEVARQYWPQVQGGLLITERQWCDVMSYFPGMPPALCRIKRNEAYIATLAEALEAFNAKLDAKRKRLIALGHIKMKEGHSA